MPCNKEGRKRFLDWNPFIYSSWTCVVKLSSLAVTTGTEPRMDVPLSRGKGVDCDLWRLIFLSYSSNLVHLFLRMERGIKNIPGHQISDISDRA
ncbi:hypothetical protein CEXT_764041 [Caerostris extrusa]|uniref:Uncharacterized protein n=1 Tax=Caerostris extrusa TaxID=172846 RepID=A0AAV4Y8Y5_CAEEX|nr:hypothetical protein CEXT_764041 [Caerostris extrusa]